MLINCRQLSYVLTISQAYFPCGVCSRVCVCVYKRAACISHVREK